MNSGIITNNFLHQGQTVILSKQFWHKIYLQQEMTLLGVFSVQISQSIKNGLEIFDDNRYEKAIPAMPDCILRML